MTSLVVSGLLGFAVAVALVVGVLLLVWLTWRTAKPIDAIERRLAEMENPPSRSERHRGTRRGTSLAP